MKRLLDLGQGDVLVSQAIKYAHNNKRGKGRAKVPEAGSA